MTFSMDAYRSVTKDLLLFVSVPSTTGYGSQLQNVGSVRNTGIELSLTTANVNRVGVRWRTTLNVAHNRNKVLNLGTVLDTAGNPVPIEEFLLSGRTTFAFSPSATHIIRVGQPLGSIYGYKVTGLWQAGDQCYLTNPSVNCVPGEYQIADISGPDGVPDSVITGDDRIILGQGDPTFYGGLNNTLTVGRFSVDAFMTFAYGNKIVNGGNAYGGLAIMQANERKSVLDRWTPTNTDTDIPRANQARPRRLYSTLVEDGSYLRLQTLTLGYRLPERPIRGIESATVYLTGQNLWVISGYSGFDPDVYSMGGDARFGGIDIGAYPRARVWNLGVSVTF
jgi:hypothetical protein